MPLKFKIIREAFTVFLSHCKKQNTGSFRRCEFDGFMEVVAFNFCTFAPDFLTH